MSPEIRTNRRALIASTLGLAAMPGFGPHLVPDAAAQQAMPRCLAIEHVTVLSMATDAAPQADMTVRPHRG